MKPIAVVNKNTSDEIYVEIIIGTTCNFRCHYCFPGCNDGKYRWPVGNQIDAIHKNLSYMFDLYKEYGKKKFIINISGGEPTLWPELGKFVKHFKENYDARILMSSNGSRTLRWWKENAKYFSLINLSVHYEQADIDHTIQVLDYIYLNTETAVRATVLMDNTEWAKCENIVNKMKSHEVPWLLQATSILINDVVVDYTSEQTAYLEEINKKIPPIEYIQIMKQKNKIGDNLDNIFTIYDDDSKEKFSANKWYANGWHNLYGWECNLGVERFTIWPNGDIKGSCTAPNLFNLTTPLNIYDVDLSSKFSLNNIQPLICKMKYCSCKAELLLNKRKIDV